MKNSNDTSWDRTSDLPITLDLICYETTILPLYQLCLFYTLVHILSEDGIYMPKHVAVSLYTYNIFTWLHKRIISYELCGINGIEINDSLSTINLI